MHIPDGFLSAKVCAATWAISLCGIGFSLKKVAATLKDKMIPLMGVMSAFIFAAQMLNFPIFAGTSGHLLGSAFAAILLGPFAAAVVLTCVLAIQCLIFQDGGITALGANILNMALIAPLGGYCLYSFIRKITGSDKGVIASCALASWVSVVLAALACAMELAVSGTVAFKIAASAMAGMYALMGVVESAISCLMVGFILKVRQDLIYKP